MRTVGNDDLKYLVDQLERLPVPTEEEKRQARIAVAEAALRLDARHLAREWLDIVGLQ